MTLPCLPRQFWLATLGYLLVALCVLAPVLPSFSTAIPGGLIAATDGWQNVWNLWWIAEALRSGQNPLVTPLLFHPHGVDLHLQTLGLANGLPLVPVTLLWGPSAAYNLALLLALWLTGLAGYALALQVTPHHGAAFGAGLLLTLAPWHLTRLYDGQLELITLQWAVFYLVALLRVIKHGCWQTSLLAGVLLALTGLTSWYYLVFMLLVSLGVALLWTPFTLAAWRQRLGQTSLILLVAGLLLLPILGPALRTATDPQQLYQPEADEIVARSANLLDFILPSYLHPLWGEIVFRQISAAWHNYSGDWNVALGWSVLALAIYGARTSWSLAWRWLVLAGGALLLALGPELQFGPWRSGIPLPYALLDQIPGLSLGRRPSLFTAIITIALVPPLALGLTALLQARRGHPIPRSLVLGLVIFELLPSPWPLLSAQIHPIYHELAQRPGAIIELPSAAYKYVEPQRAQMVHGRPLVGGYLARSPRDPWPYLAPAVRPIWYLEPEPADPFFVGSGGPIDALVSYGITDLVVRWDQLEPGQEIRAKAILAQVVPDLAPVYADSMISVYQLPTTPAPQPGAALTGPGWHPPEGDPNQPWRWMGEQGVIALINPGPEPQRMSLSLAAMSFERPREVTLSLNEAPAGTWTVGGQGRDQVMLHFWLPAGTHWLELHAPADPEPRPNSTRLLSITLTETRLLTRP
ncbi:MAG: hypothetical protein AB4911_11810 [Oscillochloridaceae bacterium umkhey_bin13]